MKKRILLSWSSGKDSAWALHLLRGRDDLDIVALLTTVNESAGRVAMHAVRAELLHSQADCAGLPLWTVDLPWPCPNEEYEKRMRAVIARAHAAGIEAIAFGDLYLTDVREYRERMLAGTGIAPLFPLWDMPTDALAREMIAGGLRAQITCIDTRVLPATLAGAEYNAEFLAALPAGTDPCGENGEFHSFAFAGPMFSQSVAISVGETWECDGFLYTDLTPGYDGR
ncbi:MAG: ATP-binding protein [Blastocatellia bacterium]